MDKGSWEAAFIYPSPSWLWIDTTDSLKLWPLTEPNAPLIYSIAFVIVFYHSNRKRSWDISEKVCQLWNTSRILWSKHTEHWQLPRENLMFSIDWLAIILYLGFLGRSHRVAPDSPLWWITMKPLWIRVVSYPQGSGDRDIAIAQETLRDAHHQQ